MTAATNGALPKDIVGYPADGVYVPGLGATAAAGSNATPDANGAYSASQVVNIAQLGANGIATPADSVALAGTMPSVQMQQSGTALASPRRVATKLVPLAAVAITAGTPVSIYTPTTGKKYRVLGFAISDTVAGSVKFEDGTGNEVFRTPLLAASTPYNAPDMGNGFLSAAANNQLFLDLTVTGNVSGFIAIMEE